MALTITDAGNGTSTSSSSSLSTGATVTASVDDWLVAIVGADNNGTSGAASLSSVSDSQGNTWTQRALINHDPGAAAAGATLGIYVCQGVTNALASGTVTANFSPNTAAKAIQVYRVQPGVGEAIEFVASDTTGSTGSTTTHSAATVSVTNGDTIFGCAAVEQDAVGVTGDSDTTNGNWSSIIARIANTGSSASSMLSASQYKTVNATGNQSWSCTTPSAQDSARSYLILRAAIAEISATVDATEAGDTLGSSSTLDITSTLARTEDDDALTASSGLALIGSLASTEADDVATAAGAVLVTASAFVTEADDSFSASATLAIAGTVAATEGDDVPSASGTVDIVGSAAIAEANDTLDGLATIAIEGVLTVTEADDTLSADALMPIWYPRRGGTEDQDHYERRQVEWQEQLRRIIDRSWQIAHGEIDPVTLLPIPPPDYSAVIDELMRQAVALDQARVEAFITEQEQLQEEEAISLLLLAA